MPVLFWSNEVNKWTYLRNWRASRFKWVRSCDIFVFLSLIFYFLNPAPGIPFTFSSPRDLEVVKKPIYGTGFPGISRPGATTLLQILRTLPVARWAAGAGEGLGGTCQHPVSVKTICRTAIQWVNSAGKPGKPMNSRCFQIFELYYYIINYAFFHHPGWILSWPFGGWLQPCCELSPICCLKLATGRPFS